MALKILDDAPCGLPNVSAVDARELVGGLSAPSKMPGPGTSLPASACHMGSRLRKVPGSVCAKCYACHGNYTFPSVQACLERRLAALRDPAWVDAMVYAISAAGEPLFRVHDSGDLQGVWHFAQWCLVADALPLIRFWMPTKERRYVREYLRSGGVIPSNLVVRVSAPMVGQAPVKSPTGLTSTVSSGKGWKCPATYVEGIKSCAQAQCEQCWNAKTRNVDYNAH